MVGEKVFQGIGVSSGTALGRIFLREVVDLTFKNVKISQEQIAGEIERFQQAVERVTEALKYERSKVFEDLGQEEAEIWTVQLMLLEDPEIFDAVMTSIKQDLKSAEAAVNDVFAGQVQLFEDLDDDYMRGRAIDLENLRKRLLMQLLGKEEKQTEIPSDSILVYLELTPTDVGAIDKNKVVGVIAEKGGTTSHAAILLRSIGIPAVFGISDFYQKVKNGTGVAMDGKTGAVILNPLPETKNIYRAQMVKERKQKIELEKLVTLPSVTKDGQKIELFANIGSLAEARAADVNGAEGIGLFRTEFIFLGRKELPSEETQFKIYRQVAQLMGQRQVIIRTLDIGGDKKPDYIDIPPECNPFLGYRAIRLCLKEQEIFESQLRAILRASTYGRLSIMYPFVISVEEVREANRILEQVKVQLEQEKIPFDKEIPVGVMIETPAASLLVEDFFQIVDFVSVGTNDLAQYTLAVDRMNAGIAHLYNYFHPAVLRQLQLIGQAGVKANKLVGICGEMASDPLAVKLLLGLGFNELSVNPSSLSLVKSLIRETTLAEAKKIAGQALSLPSAAAVKEFLTSVTS
ncbi:MAG TPA: phosphoenolpyruvate--protein phosphotransferase [Clostridia bacterium]|nr:phosphoenolpyruvate--protein phosphotransferase [Clostridia bacterium]